MLYPIIIPLLKVQLISSQDNLTAVELTTTGGCNKGASVGGSGK